MNSNRKVLIIVENLPVPFDTRVWQEATTLAANGYTVSVICPKGKGYTQEEEFLQGVHIFRHDLPAEGNGAIGEIYCVASLPVVQPRKYREYDGP